MFRIFISLVLVVSCLTTSGFADSCLAEKKNSFKEGFLSAKLSSKLLKTEFQKYQTSPELLMQYFRYLKQLPDEPLFVINFHRTTDDLGRMVIRPELETKYFSAEDFPNASYLNGLLEYNRDFQDLDISSVENPSMTGSRKPKTLDEALRASKSSDS